MAKRLDRMALLEQLERIRYKPTSDQDGMSLERMSLAGALLQLANITHEREYALCRSVARHLLGIAPEPDDTEIPVD